MTSALDEFMNTPLGDVPKPPMLPQGTYQGVITSHKVIPDRKISKESTDTIAVVSFTIRPEFPDADTDNELLEQFTQVCPLHDVVLFLEFRVDVRGRYACQTFLASLFGENARKATITEFLPLTINRKVAFKVVHSPGNRPDETGEIPMFLNLRDVKGLPE